MPTRVFPRDAPEAHTSGPDPVTVLLVGGDIVRGWGVSTHDLALPGHLARALHTRTGRGVNVSLELVDRDDVSSVRAILDNRDLGDIDAIAIHAGLRDLNAFTTAASWTAQLTLLLDQIRDRTRDGITATVMGVPTPSRVPFLKAPAAGALDVQAEHLNAATKALCTARKDTFFMPAPMFVPQPDPANQLGRPSHYEYWAGEQADHLAPLLPTPERSSTGTPATALPVQTARQRLRSWAQLQPMIDTDKRIDTLLDRAKAVLGVDTAMFTIARGDDLIVRTTARETGVIPVAGSFCAVTLAQCGTVIIENTALDDRLTGNYPGMFYAGHPLTAPDGTRIGTFCVVSDTPPEDGIDPVIFRDLALQIQKQL